MADTELRERAIAQFMLSRLDDHGFVLAGFGGLREHGVSDLVEGRVVLVTTDAHRHSAGLREVGEFLGDYLHGSTHRHVPGVGLVRRSAPDPWPVCTFAMEYEDHSMIELQLGTAERFNGPTASETGPVAPRARRRSLRGTMGDPDRPLILALGPTNTGKTHRAVERMLEHRVQELRNKVRTAVRELSNSGAVHRHAYLMIDEVRRTGVITDQRLLDLARAGDPDFIRGHLVHQLENAGEPPGHDFDLPGDQLDADRLAALRRRCTDWAEAIVRSVRPDDRFDPFLADRVPEMAKRHTISAPELARRLIEAARPHRGHSGKQVRTEGTDRRRPESDSAAKDGDNVTYVDQRRWRLGPRRGRGGREA